MQKTFFLFFILFTAGTGSLAQHATHIVRAGETLFSISREYDATVTELREWNNLPDNTVRIGQRLMVGIDEDEAERERTLSESEPDTLIHTVNAGETLFRISRMYNVTVDEIKKWNNLEDQSISIDQQLKIKTIPGDTKTDDYLVQPDEVEDPDVPKTEEPGIYEVRPGDTLIRIAVNFNMTVDELKSINNLDDSRLFAGQKLQVRSRPAPPPSVAAEWDKESTPQGKFIRYTITKQDSIPQLLQYYRMDRYEFRALNPGTTLSDLRPGDNVTLLLPAVPQQENPYLLRISHRIAGEISVSRYPDGSRGNTTTSGDLYNPDALTAAHPSLPLGTVAFIENPETGHGIFVHINDRTSENRLVLSNAAYRLLDYPGSTQLVAKVHKNSNN